MIKAVFFDIDGTLVSFETHEVSASTRKAITELRNKGIKVFIATGRHLKAIDNLGDLEFDGYITLNGSYCFAGKNQVIYKHSIVKEDLEILLDYMEREHSFPCMFVREQDMVINYINERAVQLFELLNFPNPPVGDLRKALEEDVFQLIAFFTPEEEVKVMKLMPNCEATRWTPMFTDVVPFGSSKRIGIDNVIAHYGISIDETMAFGDGGNDISMLKHVGIGVAMGNAKDDVKEVADYVTTSVDDDGVANALNLLGVL